MTPALGLLFVLTFSIEVIVINSRYEQRSHNWSLTEAQDDDFTCGASKLSSLFAYEFAEFARRRCRDRTDDCMIIWKRSASFDTDCINYIDVPLDEAAELYNINIMNATSGVRTLASVASSTIT